MDGTKSDHPNLRRFEINNKEKLIFNEKKLSLEITKIDIYDDISTRKRFKVTLLFKAFENNLWITKDNHLEMYYDNSDCIPCIIYQLRGYRHITIFDKNNEDTIIVDIGNWDIK